MNLRFFRMSAIARATLLGLALLLSATAQADDRAFSTLPPDEQRVLTPFADSWDGLDAATREQLRRGAQRWLSMSPEQRARAAERLADWQRLPPEQRERLREAHQRYRALSPEQQQRLQQRFREFQNLPPEQRRELRRRFEAMGPAERRAFLQGAEAMRRSGQARPPGPFAHLPPEAREASWAMVRSLSPEARRALRAEFETLPAEQRELLRQELMAMTPAEREARLLRSR